jgi:hypothetical protein
LAEVVEVEPYRLLGDVDLEDWTPTEEEDG